MVSRYLEKRRTQLSLTQIPTRVLHGAERNQPSPCGEHPAGSPGLTPEVSDEPAATTAHAASPLRQEPQEGLRAPWGHMGATPLPGAQGSSGGGRGGGGRSGASAWGRGLNVESEEWGLACVRGQCSILQKCQLSPHESIRSPFLWAGWLGLGFVFILTTRVHWNNNN